VRVVPGAVEAVGMGDFGGFACPEAGNR